LPLTKNDLFDTARAVCLICSVLSTGVTPLCSVCGARAVGLVEQPPLEELPFLDEAEDRRGIPLYNQFLPVPQDQAREQREYTLVRQSVSVCQSAGQCLISHAVIAGAVFVLVCPPEGFKGIKCRDFLEEGGFKVSAFPCCFHTPLPQNICRSPPVHSKCLHVIVYYTNFIAWRVVLCNRERTL